jgi:molecular chaperone DnaK (HSP70)
MPELPEGMTVLKVISDYLKDFHKNICNEMQGALGARDFDKKKAQFRYCLTVPAMWTDRAKTIMREAAIQAGIIDREDHPDRLILIGEPESAALYSEKMKGGITIKSGETLMICDAGGGTIDLTTFKKTIEGESKSFQEITEGYGNSCGSAQLDLNLKNYILRMTKSRPIPITEKAMDELLDHFQKQVKVVCNIQGILSPS